MWNKMEVFYYVAKAGSFTRAARLLNTSQPALSRTIAALEDRLGCVLFDRRPRGLALTRKGTEAFQAAQHMFMNMDGLKANLQEEQEVAGKIRISSTYAIVNYILAPYIIKFKEIYPKINFEIYCNDQIIDIIQNEVDLAVRPYESDNNEIIQEHLFTLQANLYASRNYISQYGEPKTLEDLSKHKFIAFSRPETLPYADLEWFLKFGDQNRARENCILRVNSVEMHFQAAQKGLGIISSYEDMEITKKSDLIKILPDFKGPRYKEFLIYPKHLKQLKKIKAFSDFIMETFGRSKSNTSHNSRFE
jgi:DNA-binding transcriptional LysR family regulator